MKEFNALDEFPLYERDKKPADDHLEGRRPEHPETSSKFFSRYGNIHIPSWILVSVAIITVGALIFNIFLNIQTWQEIETQVNQTAQALEELRQNHQILDSIMIQQYDGAVRPYIHITTPSFSFKNSSGRKLVRIEYNIRNAGNLPGKQINVGSWLEESQSKKITDSLPTIERTIPSLYPNEEKGAFNLSGYIPAEILVKKPFLHIVAIYKDSREKKHRLIEIFYCVYNKTENRIEAAMIWRDSD